MRVLYLDLASPSERFEDAVVYAELSLICRHISNERDWNGTIVTVELYSSQSSARPGVSPTIDFVIVRYFHLDATGGG